MLKSFNWCVAPRTERALAEGVILLVEPIISGGRIATRSIVSEVGGAEALRSFRVVCDYLSGHGTMDRGANSGGLVYLRDANVTLEHVGHQLHRLRIVK